MTLDNTELCFSNQCETKMIDITFKEKQTFTCNHMFSSSFIK